MHHLPLLFTFLAASTDYDKDTSIKGGYRSNEGRAQCSDLKIWL